MANDLFDEYLKTKIPFALLPYQSCFLLYINNIIQCWSHKISILRLIFKSASLFLPSKPAESWGYWPKKMQCNKTWGKLPLQHGDMRFILASSMYTFPPTNPSSLMLTNRKSNFVDFTFFAYLSALCVPYLITHTYNASTFPGGLYFSERCVIRHIYKGFLTWINRPPKER